MKRAAALFLGLVLGGASLSCNGTTGDSPLSFQAYASGVPGASEPFQAGGFTIQLTAVRMHIGAIYFDEAPPSAESNSPICISSGTYAAEVPGPVDVDLLSTTPQTFAVYGNGTADTAVSWQIWLTDDNVGQDNVDVANFTPIVQLQGLATDASGAQVSFGAIVTINTANRSKGSSDPAQPGNSPICKLRIVQIGGLDVSFFPGGVLRMTVDPRIWFTQQSLPIDFSPGQLPPITDNDCNPDSAVFTNPQSYALAPSTPPPGTQTCGGSGQACCSANGTGSSQSTCLGALTCTEGVCGPAYCIPNSSFLTGADPGASAGADLFSEITSAAPFSVSYGQH
jgi:hypothetical protein